MLYDLFIKQYVGYAAYHQDDRNEITHFFGVPPIFMSAIFLLSASVFRFGDLTILGVPVSVGLIVFCLLAASWIALDLILGGVVFLLMLPVLIYAPGWADAVEAGSLLGIWGVVFVFLGIQFLAWSVQILGHVFEGRRPRILENFLPVDVGHDVPGSNHFQHAGVAPEAAGACRRRNRPMECRTRFDQG